MSTSAYYNFITAPKTANQATHVLVEPHQSSIEAHRQAAVSPSSFTTASSSNSSSSLYQFNSLTPTSSAASSSSPSSSSSSSSSSTTSSTNSNLFSRNHRDFLRQTSITPTQTHHHHLTGHQHHASQLFHSYTLHSLEPKPLKPFKNKSDYLEAMKEDLSEWLNKLYNDLDLTPDNFFAQLETGSIICRHANNVTQMGRNSLMEQNARDASLNNSQHELSKLNISNSDNSSSNNNNSQESADTDSSPTPSSNQSNSFSSSTNSLHHNNQQQSNKYCSLSSSFGQISLSPTQKSDNRTINWFRIKILPYKQDACPGTFFARDNICQFILWCRSLNIRDCLLFETDDLVARKNEKSFILCLLEVARIGFKVGMPTPLIIQLEQEIDREIENDARRALEEKQNKANGTNTDSYGENEPKSDTATYQINKQEKGEDENSLDEAKAEVRQNERKDDEVERVEVEEGEEEDTGPKPQVITNDLVSLHEKVVRLLCQCTCPTQFPMVRVGDNGKYKVGDKLIIFVRILRRHIMVRVGGGWQELSEFLRVKDPCRSRSCHQQQLNNSHNQINQTTMTHQLNDNHHQQLHTKFTPNPTITVPKSHFSESGYHLNKGHLNNNSATTNNNNNTGQLCTTKTFGGQRLISGSASMSWLSHNS